MKKFINHPKKFLVKTDRRIFEKMIICLELIVYGNK